MLNLTLLILRTYLGKTEEEELPPRTALHSTDVLALHGKIEQVNGITTFSGVWSWDWTELMKEGGFAEPFEYKGSSAGGLSGTYIGGFRYEGQHVVDKNFTLTFDSNCEDGFNVIGTGNNDVGGSFIVEGYVTDGVVYMCRTYVDQALCSEHN